MKAKIALVCAGLLLGSAVHLRADSLDQIAKQISKAAPKLKNKRIAVLPFPYHDGRESKDSSIISERLVTKIVGRNKLEVVERSLLEKVLSELKLQYSGVISQESAKQLGNVLGVEAILTGTLIELDEKQFEINARLINAESGLVLTAASGKENKLGKETRTETAAETTSSGEAKKTDMSVYFHSQKYHDSRFDVSQKNESSSGQNNVVFSNVPDRGAPGFMGGEDNVLDSPADTFGRNVDEQQDLVDLQNGWEAPEEQKEQHFLQLRDKYRRAKKPRTAAVAQLYLAQSLLKNGKHEQAIHEAKPVTRMDDFPKLKARAVYLIARSLEASGRPELAKNLYREIVQNFPFESRLIRAAGYRIRR